MPRLNHRKTRTGCQRCKARKVKCDEAQPKCGACARHNVDCKYFTPTRSRQRSLQSPKSLAPDHASTTTTAPAATTATTGSTTANANANANPKTIPAGAGQTTRTTTPYELEPTAKLEIRLMHHWTAYACSSFGNTSEFWRLQAPLIALDHAEILDAMLAIAALHYSRSEHTQWSPVEGRMVPARELQRHAPCAARPKDMWTVIDFGKIQQDLANLAERQAQVESKRRSQMANVSRLYFDSAIDGHRKAVQDLDLHNMKACFIASVLIGLYALFILSEPDTGGVPLHGPRCWFISAGGCRLIALKWIARIGEQRFLSVAGMLYGKPDLLDIEELCHERHRRPFSILLTHREDLEAESNDDRLVYQKTLSYIGTIFRGIVEGTDNFKESFRRVCSMPSSVPTEFGALLDQHKPRALTLLLYFFAAVKLLDEHNMWFKGIAEVQAPSIVEQIPPEWQPLLQWPLQLIRGQITLPPPDSDFKFDDILSIG